MAQADPGEVIFVRLSKDEVREMIREEIALGNEVLIEKLGEYIDNLSGIIGQAHEGGVLGGG